jgi:hypothetical protein
MMGSKHCADGIWSCDPDRFRSACAQVRQQYEDGGIGTLGEKSIHAILKCYFESDADCHECPVEHGVADISGVHGIIEIQTRQFQRLTAKLSELLPEGPVTVVYPVIRRKRILWMNPETGELIRSGTFRAFQKPECVFPELYRIRKYVLHPNFRLCIVMMDAEDFRLDDYRTTKVDRVPTTLVDVRYYSAPADYRTFLPEALPETFTSMQLSRLLNVPRTMVQSMLRMLVLLGQAEVCGKEGNTKIYRRAAAPAEIKGEDSDGIDYSDQVS